MEQNRTLGSSLRQGTPREGKEQAQVTELGEGTTKSFNTYLTLFAINLAHRFPDVSDIDSIDYKVVRQVAEFSVAASRVALEIWEDINLPVSGRRRNM